MFKNILIKLQELSINTDLQWFWPVMLAASVALTLTMDRRCNTQIFSFSFSADYRRLARFIYATRSMSQDSVSKTVHWTVKVFLFVFHIFKTWIRKHFRSSLIFHTSYFQSCRLIWLLFYIVLLLLRTRRPVYVVYPKFVAYILKISRRFHVFVGSQMFQNQFMPTYVIYLCKQFHFIVPVLINQCYHTDN